MNDEIKNDAPTTPAADAGAGDLSGLSGLSGMGGGAPTATATEEAEVSTRPLAAPEPPDAHGWWGGTGRRKTAVARVRIKPGSGEVKVQVSRKKFKTVDEYFTEMRDRNDVHAPLKVTETLGKMDVVIRASGGGYMGQAQAVLLGIARALKKYDPSLEQALRDHGLLTRDAREVERKKYGQAGARRRFQFSKR